MHTSPSDARSDSPSDKNVYHVRGKLFVTDKRYEVSKRLGQGAYGLLAEALDRKSGECVAIKKVASAFDDVAACKRTLREVRLLRHFRHENVLSLVDIMTPPARGQWNDIYLVLERMDTDLHFVIHSGQFLSSAHMRWMMYQLLRGLKAIHSARAMHRDLKPSNLLLNRNCDLKICDFGLARGLEASRSPLRRAGSPGEPPSDSVHSPLTEYVVTRWYRAPELLVGNRDYDQSVDLWSVGCILGEVLARRVLFKGKHPLHQTRLIIEGLGAPPADVLSRTVENPAAAAFIGAMSSAPSDPPAERMPAGTPAEAIELMGQLLAFDPAERSTAADAIGHALFDGVRGLNDEPDAPPFDFAFEGEALCEDDLRDLVLLEMEAFHPERRGAVAQAQAA